MNNCSFLLKAVASAWPGMATRTVTVKQSLDLIGDLAGNNWSSEV